VTSVLPDTVAHIVGGSFSIIPASQAVYILLNVQSSLPPASTAVHISQQKTVVVKMYLLTPKRDEAKLLYEVFTCKH